MKQSEHAKLREQGKKRCSKCGKIKKLDEFNKNAKQPSGRQIACRKCQHARQRDPEWRARYNARRRAQRKALAAENSES